MVLTLTTGLVVLTSGQTAPPKVSMRIENYYWKVPIGQERRFKEERGDWVISVLLSREAEDYAPRYGWAKEKPGWGRSPVLRSKTSIKRVDLRYRGQSYIVRTGLRDLYNPEWIRADLVQGGLDIALELYGYGNASIYYEVKSRYRHDGISRRIVDRLEEDAFAEERSFRPVNWPSIF